METEPHQGDAAPGAKVEDRPGTESGPTASTTSSDRSSDRAPLVDRRRQTVERYHLLAVLVVVVGLPLASAWTTGSLALPHNDDWAFLRIAFGFAETGKLQLLNWGEMMLVGQILWALPVIRLFGESATALNTAVALIAAGGLVAAYSVCRRFLPHSKSLFVVLLIGLFPGFGVSVTSFMTDVPALALQMACLAVGLNAIDQRARDQPGAALTLLGSIGLGFLGLSIREFAIAAPVAVVAGFALAERRSRRVPVAAAASLGLLLGAFFALYRWRQSFPGTTSPGDLDFTFQEGVVLSLTAAFFTTAWGLLPLTALLPRRPSPVAARLWNGAALVAAVLGVRLLLKAGTPFLGNLFSERGALQNLVLDGDRPVLFPEWIWAVIVAAALVGGCLLAGDLRLFFGGRRRWRLPRIDPATAALVAFGLVHLALLVFRCLTGGYFFDRYLWGLAFVLAVLVARHVELPSRPTPALALATLAVVAAAFVTVTASHAFDSARWAGGRVAVSAGIPVGDVDAGFEWVGFHYPGPAYDSGERRSVGGPWYLGLFPRAGNCGVVRASPSNSGDDVLMAVVERPYLFGLREQRVWVYWRGPACTSQSAPRAP